MVRLAPSATNFQPWRIIKASEPDMFHFYLRRAPGLKQLFSMKSDLQRIDIGIAMCHFELAADEEGLRGKWTVNNPLLRGMADKLEYMATWVGSN